MQLFGEYIDPSTLAAWTALIVSIIGTVISPIITSLINNRHQLKLYKLQSSEKRIDSANQERISVFNSFISNTGKCLSVSSIENLSDFGASYFAVYQYVPVDQFDSLDQLYRLIISNRWDDARKYYVDIIHALTALLKEPLQ